MQKTILVLSGPSGVGKGPLIAALGRRISLKKVLPLTTQPQVQGGRERRTGRFLGTGEVLALAEGQYVIDIVRDQTCALSLQELEDALKEHDVVLLNLFYTTVRKFLAHPRTEALRERGLRIVTAFISPLTEKEIRRCAHLEAVVPALMMANQIRRALAESETDPIDSMAQLGMTLRTLTAVEEVRNRGMFDYLIALDLGHLPCTWAANTFSGGAGSGSAVQKLLMILQSS